jgi:threonine dehydratase
MLPEFRNLLDAKLRISGYIHKTPVMTSTAINNLAGSEIYFKCENFQRMGAFKMRGALNAILMLNDEERRAGVATHSSGNFAQALALSAKLTGSRATVIMPRTSPEVKKNAVRGYGADIIECEPTLAAREETTNEFIKKTGASFLHPFNDFNVIYGQGTAAMEFLDEVSGLELIFAPVGGGGLISGTALAVHYMKPSAKVYGVEPLGADDAYWSLKKGEIQPSVNPVTIADGLLTALGDRTFSIMKELVTEIIRVDEKEIIEAMRLLWERMKIVVEPSGAVALAALLKEKEKFRGKKSGIILSGGNVDLGRLPF